MSSESPKWIALVLSIFAITISGLSWWEAHRNRVINEEINRPILNITEVSTTRGFPDPKTFSKGEALVVFHVTLKNTGKASAEFYQSKIEAQLEGAASACKQSPIDRSIQIPDGLQVLIGEQRTFFTVVAITRECNNVPLLEFHVTANLTYLDAGSKRQYFQRLFKDVEVLPKQLRHPL